MTTAKVAQRVTPKPPAPSKTKGKIEVPDTTPPQAKGWNEDTPTREIRIYRGPSTVRAWVAGIFVIGGSLAGIGAGYWALVTLF